MAVTAHYVHEGSSHLKLRIRLIAFRHIPGSHEGAAIGRHFVEILTDLKIQHKIGQITADNASNNHTMVGWIEDALAEYGIPFCRLANRVWYVKFLSHSHSQILTLPRCFPHIINLAAQAFTDALKHTPAARDINSAFLELLRTDVIGRLRDLIVACRTGSLRREEFRQAVLELRKSGEKVPLLALIYDITMRWSAMFNMIDRFLLIHVVSRPFQLSG